MRLHLRRPGNCDISGNIVMCNFKSGAKSISFMKGTRAVGEPVPGAEILIEQEPNDVPVQCALTDQNGDYTLTDIPIGNQYHLVVDVPGYPMLSTFVNISINSNDTLLDNYNFLLDTTSGGGIFIDTTSGIVSHFVEFGFNSIKVFPNPVSEFMMVEFDLSKDNSVSIDLLDELGATIKQMLYIDKCKKGAHNYQLDFSSSFISRKLFY